MDKSTRTKPKPILMERTRKGRPLVNLRLGDRPPPLFPLACKDSKSVLAVKGSLRALDRSGADPKGWLFRGKGGKFQTDLGLDECRKRFFGQLGEAILRQQLVFKGVECISEGETALAEKEVS